MAQAPKTQDAQTQDPKASAVPVSGNFVLIKTTNGTSRRRAGLRFTPEGVRVNVDDLSKDQIAEIEADKHLKVAKAKE